MILVTGGAGYIGSHMCMALIESGQDVVVLDDLSSGHRDVFKRILQLTGNKLEVVVSDVRDKRSLTALFEKYPIEAVFHFAAKKSIPESIRDPGLYYSVNISGLLNLCEVMQDFSVNKLVFSSSAAVYGEATSVPIDEKQPAVSAHNPYGTTKVIGEKLLSDLCNSQKDMRVASLRYFNPIGAHPSGEIGEHVTGEPSNLVPYILKVATGQLDMLTVYGDDYPTLDGTGVRDYIHVMDLVRGHLRALEALNLKRGFNVWNLGTGKGYSVLQMVKTFEAVTGVTIRRTQVARREGDVASSYADVRKAKEELNWVAESSVSEALNDAWRWCQKYPTGYSP
jgi:UDP-glucose 4-epimerase